MIPKTVQTKLLAVMLATTTTTYAEVVLDGTLGPQAELAGIETNGWTEFKITDNLGKQIGDNLFHSFAKFNINTGEIASFSGPDTIQNVISRVTGGESSYIDGDLHSSMPNADMYLLNPAGVMFGPNAWLDIQGSLHVSTADYLRLGTEGRFDATYPERSVLTVAPPSAFGFLSESPTPSGVSKQSGFLSVPRGKMLSFIGGDLTLQDSQFPTEYGPLNSYMMAPDGQINLVSVASSGEIPVNFTEIPNNAFAKFGKIVITDNTDGLNNSSRQFANVDVSGNGGGSIYIIGGEIVLDNGYVWADTLGNEEGQGITIKATESYTIGFLASYWRFLCNSKIYS